ncbi:MAG: ATP-binding cassette domain-containing protein [Actinomycetota bacterium]|nr:ATP-binding cassette domain-containing protein [Actinomycetota bacterium]
MLRIDRLHKSFGEVTALDGCSFIVKPGQMLGLLGPNGAGKTTLMRGVFGLIRPDAGGVSWHGEAIDQSVRRRFGYMPEERGLYPKLEVRWQLIYLGRLHGMTTKAAAEASDRWLAEFSLEDRSTSKVGELSHGNQQRVQLIAALLHDPDMVILDEPFAGLDPIAAEFMAGVLADLADQGKAILFSSHQLDVVEDLCQEVTIMHEGRVVLEGVVDDLRAASKVRYVEVTGDDTSWVSGLPDAEIVSQAGGRIRVLLRDGERLDDVARLMTGTSLTQFIYEPPPLSEVFRKAVAS